MKTIDERNTHLYGMSQNDVKQTVPLYRSRQTERSSQPAMF